ncbi:hypothetical protein N335_10355, partial [Phaethon lepturus]
SPPGPGDDTQVASPLDPSEQPFAVSTAYGIVEPVDVAEWGAARERTQPTSKSDSCKEVDNLVSGDAPLAVAPGDGVVLPAQETEGFTREKKRY